MQHRKLFLWLMCIGLGLMPITATADIVEYWDSGGVGVCTEDSLQTQQVVLSDGEGMTFVAWLDRRRDTEDDITGDLYVQKIGSDGESLWENNGLLVCDSESIDETGHLSFEWPCRMVSDGTGGVIVLWTDYRTENYSTAYAQRITSSGYIEWTDNGVEIWPLDLTSLRDIQSSDVVSDGSGGALIVGRQGGDKQLYLQRIDTRGRLKLSDALAFAYSVSYDEGMFDVISDLAGGVYVTYETEFQDIFLTRLDSKGDYVWGPGSYSVIVCNADYRQCRPSLIADGSGGVIVGWLDYRLYDPEDPNSEVAVFAQRIDSQGTSIWNTNGIQVSPSYRPADSIKDKEPFMASCANGASLYAWSEGNHLGTTTTKICVQRVDGDGNVAAGSWSDYPDGLPVAQEPLSKPYRPTLASDGNQGALVAWEDGRGTVPAVYIQHIKYLPDRLELQGAENGDQVYVQDEAQHWPLLAASDGTIVWQDNRNAASTGQDLYAQKCLAFWAPELYSPYNGASLDYDPDSGIPFEWHMLVGSSTYLFQLDGNEAFTSPYEDTFCLCHELHETSTIYVPPLETGTYYWRLKSQEYGLWSAVWLFEIKKEKPTPGGGRPHVEVYPNPLNPSTTISFDLPRQEHVLLQIYDIRGKRVTTLVDETRGQGTHQVVWNGTDSRGLAVASGQYFYRFQAGETVINQKLLLLK